MTEVPLSATSYRLVRLGRVADHERVLGRFQQRQQQKFVTAKRTGNTGHVTLVG
jgi:hypothetical protein